ncbi:MAG: PEP-CTERM sorting domain-containing protein [Puniceicoccaceae bacterium]
MTKLLSTLIAFAIIGMASLSAQNTVSYSWEDGGTILGSFGNLTNPLNVTAGTWNAQNISPQDGSFMLQVEESPISGTPQAYIAAVTGLTDGDQVTASFYGWSHVDGGSPSMRIWGHYATSADILGYSGSASGNSTFTAGEGVWSQVSHTWTFDSDTGNRDALIIEARLYSVDDGNPMVFWVDNLSVTAPGGATILTPVPEPSTYAAILGLIGLAFVAYRRRK